MAFNIKETTMGKRAKYAKRMRTNPTSGELVMLGRLEMSRIKFKFQAEVGCYIVDFLIPKKLIVIEVDGKYHEQESAIAYDAKRQKYLERMGLKVLRCKNEEASTFDLPAVVLIPDASPQDVGRVMGKSGAWKQAMNKARYRRICERKR
jgi:very-short-patch-repair endonuclease